jgi:flagellar hook-associated protein 3 FlgL
MRVTESRMLEQATSAVSEARNRASKATEVMSNGKRVQRPSDDPAAWAQGARASARQLASTQRGFVISTASSALSQSEDALKTIGLNLSRASEVAVQAANGTLTDEDRRSLLPLLQGLRDANIAAANRTGADGEYLFAGSKGDARPFDANGDYQGDSLVRTVESGEGARLAATIPGSALTGGNGGVDVLKSIDALIAAVSANDVPAIQAANGTLKTAVAQTADTRSQVGARMSALSTADDAREEFEVQLAQTLETALDADPVAAASELARSAGALEKARAVAQEIVGLVRSSR